MNKRPSDFKLRENYPYYLAGKPVFANKHLQVTDKYTNEVATFVAQADSKVIDEAIEKAKNSQKELNKMASYERRDILNYVVEQVKKRFDEFAFSLAIEAGKPLKDAKGEVNRLIDTFQIAAEESVRIYGEYSKLDISDRTVGMEMITKRFPIGPISMISPFNFPLNLAAHKIAPAIAAGCTWVMKPASRTPIGALLIAEILSETKLPADSFSVLPVDRKGADLFTTDDRFKLLSFTGSPDVGWELKKNSGKKKVVLELGGNAACIVDRDANLDYVTDRIIVGAFYQSGQSCISVQRVIIHEEIYDTLKTKLVEKTKTLKKGDPLDIETFIGPMISEGEAKRCESWTQEALEKGATLLVGGKREGVMFDATILENVDTNSKVYAEEVFGPIFVIEKFSDFKKAVETVNDSKFGLQAGVFSSNIDKCFYAFNNIDVGGVVINDVPSIRVDSQPYGGVKDSGLGREGLKYAIEDMTEIRAMLLKKVGDF
eukprot:gene9542-1747_t